MNNETEEKTKPFPHPLRRATDHLPKHWLLQLLGEMLILSPLVIIGAWILIPDEANKVVEFMIGIIFLFSALAIFIRRLMFPDLNLPRTWRIAHESSIGAAIVFFSVCFLLSAIFIGSVSLLR